MKSLFIFLLSICTISVHAQVAGTNPMYMGKQMSNSYKLAVDSIVNTSYTNGDVYYLETYKFAYHYLHDGKVRHFRNIYGPVNNGQMSSKTEFNSYYDYDYRNELVSSLIRTGASKDTLYSEISYFNKKGLDTCIRAYYGPVNKNRKYYKLVRTYDSNDLLVKEDYYDSTSAYYYANSYSYDSNKALIKREEKSIDRSVTRDINKELFSYNQQGQLIERIKYTFHQFTPNEYDTLKYTYNSSGKISSSLICRLSSKIKAEFIYDGSKLSFIRYYSINSSMTDFVLGAEYEYIDGSATSFAEIAYLEQSPVYDDYAIYKDKTQFILPNQVAEIKNYEITASDKVLRSSKKFFYKTYLSGITKQKPQLLSIYPNPVSDQLNLQLETKAPYTFKIHTISGQLIMSGTMIGNSIPTSNLKAGQYILNVETQDGKACSGRFVKE